MPIILPEMVIEAARAFRPRFEDACVDHNLTDQQETDADKFYDRVMEEHFIALAPHAVLMRDFLRTLVGDPDVGEDAGVALNAITSFLNQGLNAWREHRDVVSVSCAANDVARLAAIVWKSGSHPIDRVLERSAPTPQDVEDVTTALLAMIDRWDDLYAQDRNRSEEENREYETIAHRIEGAAHWLIPIIQAWAVNRNVYFDEAAFKAFISPSNLYGHCYQYDQADVDAVTRAKENVRLIRSAAIQQLLAEMNRPYAACTAFRRALAAEPFNLRAHYNLADTLDEMGRADEARAHWQAYVQADTRSECANYARSKLA